MLRDCVKKCPSWKVKGVELKALLPIVSRIIYAGVRAGGASHFWPWINYGHARRDSGGR